ncbi:S-layer homology domain-containing protein [Paenibacillus sp. GYB003]|uniref:S-layer homology domain-containing protein n=1 Tax=Paenibacillus sp. GYB003 TaxID=2994392 RepID=UPI002F96B593
MWKQLAVPVFLGAALAASAAGGETASASFADSASHWAKESIEKAVGKGYVDGYEDKTFRPDRQVSRGEFVKMVVTALKLPVSGKTDGGEWYVPYANAAVSAGIHRWSDFAGGDWNTPITRQEMARMVVRATDRELQKAETNKPDGELMYLATKAGLIQGLSGGELGEGEATTRAQSVTVIERILTVNGGGKLEVDKYAVNRAELAWHKTNIFTVMPEFFGKVLPISNNGVVLTDGWNPDNLFVETPDGNFRAELDSVIAIDMDDPSDPHRNLLGDVSKLKWWNPFTRNGQSVFELSNCYVIYFKGRVAYNRDTSTYVNSDVFASQNISGILTDRQDMENGIISGVSNIYQNKLGDYPAKVIPKKVKTRGEISINISAPAIPPNNIYTKYLLNSKVPESIE